MANMDFQMQRNRSDDTAAANFQMKYSQVIDICGCVSIRMITLNTKVSKACLNLSNVQSDQVSDTTTMTRGESFKMTLFRDILMQ